MAPIGFWRGVACAMLLSLFPPAGAQGPSAFDLIASWRVSVQGEVRDRTLVVQGAAATADGSLVFKGRYGFVNDPGGPISGRVTPSPEGRRLTMTVPSTGSVIAVVQSPDGEFSGTITYRSGEVKPVTLTRMTTTDSAGGRGAASPTVGADSVLGGAQIEDLIEQSRSTESGAELRAQAGADSPKTDDRHELGIFYHKRGIANIRLGDYGRAIEDLRLALSNIQPGRPTPGGWGQRLRIQNDLARTYRERSDWFAAIELWRSMAQEYQHTSPFTYLHLQCQLMSASVDLGLWADATRARAEAEATLPRLREMPGWASEGFAALGAVAFHTGGFYLAQGNRQEAESRFRAALESAEKNVELRRILNPKDMLSARDSQGFLGQVRNNLAKLLSTRGKYGEAELYARAGLGDALRLNSFYTNGVANGLESMAWIRLQQGDIEEAEKYYRYALAAVEGAGVATHSNFLSNWRASMANMHVIRGRWADALALYEVRDQGLRSDAAQFKRIGSNHVGWAYMMHKTGQSKSAVQMLGTMITNRSMVQNPDRWHLAHLRGVLGISLAALGRINEALKVFRESIPDLVRRDQDDGAEDNSGYWRVFWQRVILEGYLELLASLHVKGEAIHGINLVDETFSIADIARGSQVQEAIAATAVRAQLPDASLAELARREHDARNRIVALNKALSYLAGTREHEQRAKLIADVQNDIARLRKERIDLRAEITKRHPEYAELTDPKPVGLTEARKALAPGEALVSIYVGETQSYVWTLGTQGKNTFRVIPVKRDDIDKDVDELRRAVDFGDGNPNRMPAFDLARAHKLYRTYLYPDRALWQDAQVLNVIAHGPLGAIPLSLLITEAPKNQPAAGAQIGYSDAPWLIRKVAIAQLPSASALTALRRAPVTQAQRKAFIGFGDPVFTNEGASGTKGVRNLAVRKIADPMEQQLAAMAQGKPAAPPTGMTNRSLAQAFDQLAALPDTADELVEIAAVLKADPDRDLYLNRRATERNVKQTPLSDRRVIAFATHGIAPGELTGLDQPALALSNPVLTGDTDNDGFLTMEEVLGLKLNADWVVLSACNTGSADGRGSEAVSGLGRAFFYAGARSLLVSNWAVETTSAKLLTTELFKKQAENPQLTRAEALRQSMLTVMTRKAPGGYSYAHPAFWAPFSLVGDGGR